MNLITHVFDVRARLLQLGVTLIAYVYLGCDHDCVSPVPVAA